MLTKKYLLYFVFIVDTVFANDYINQLMYSLEQILQFCLRNDRVLDINLLFGVAIVAGQLKVIEKYDVDNRLQDGIQTINRIASDIFEKEFRPKADQSTHYDITQKKILSPDLWSFNNPSKFLNQSSALKISRQEFNSGYLQNGDRFRETYETCLKYLLDSCHVPAECSDSILNYKGGGYVITHQILYLQITRRLVELKTCSFPGFLDFDNLINEKCSHVYNEMTNADGKLHYNETVVDLLFEEVVVCGLENYAEFFETKYLKMATDSSIGMDQNATIDDKKETRIRTLAHLFSVKMAVIVLYLKRLVQEQYYRALTYSYENLLSSSISRKNNVNLYENLF